MTTSCNHGLKVVYGIEGFTMMNLATFIGYKIYLFCYDMAEFVRSGNLPDAASLSLRKKLIYIFWSLFAAFFVLYILTNIYFLVQQIFTIKHVQVFQMGFETADCVLYVTISVLYFISSRKLLQMRLMSDAVSTESS